MHFRKYSRMFPCTNRAAGSNPVSAQASTRSPVVDAQFGHDEPIPGDRDHGPADIANQQIQFLDDLRNGDPGGADLGRTRFSAVQDIPQFVQLDLDVEQLPHQSLAGVGENGGDQR